jgi:hypothetical protein
MNAAAEKVTGNLVDELVDETDKKALGVKYMEECDQVRK